MAGYCLKNGRIQEAWGEDAAGRELAAVFHLTADGEMKELHEFPALSEGEGALAYTEDDTYLSVYGGEYGGLAFVILISAATEDELFDGMLLDVTNTIRPVK